MRRNEFNLQLVALISAGIVLLSFFLALVTSYSCEGFAPGLKCDDASVVAHIGTKALLWPALLIGRLGFSHTWLGLPVLAILFLFGLKNLERSKRFKCLVLGVVVYVVLGPVYVFLMPVPTPAYSRFHLRANDGSGDSYLEAYEASYRAGMINEWRILEGDFSPAISEGLWEGYFAGIKEWMSLMPGVTEAEYGPP